MEPPTDDEREALLEELRAIGAERKTLESAKRLPQVMRREQLNERIRVLAAEAERVGVTRTQMAETLGVARWTLYTVLNAQPVLS